MEFPADQECKTCGAYLGYAGTFYDKDCYFVCETCHPDLWRDGKIPVFYDTTLTLHVDRPRFNAKFVSLVEE